jgi:hypothetical protein
MTAFWDKLWRRVWDLNPRRACTLSGFQDRRLQPLDQLSLLTTLPVYRNKLLIVNDNKRGAFCR